MDNKYLLAAVRYIAMNPVKAGLSKRPAQYRWSSTATYLKGKEDNLVKRSGLNAKIDDWSEFFKQGVDSVLAEKMRRHEHTGRPLGSENFVVKLEKISGRILKLKKAGRPKKGNAKNAGKENN